MTTRPLIAALLLAGAAGSHAATVFSDDFDANPTGLNGVPAGWTVTDGTVDLIGAGSGHDFLPGNGVYVDLDGSTGNAGVLSTDIDLVAGTQYFLSFDLAGSQRGDSNTVDIAFETFGTAITLAPTLGFTTFHFDFVAQSTGSFAFSFSNRGNDNIGALLDNVNVSAVPELPMPAMFGIGLLALGALKRRR